MCGIAGYYQSKIKNFSPPELPLMKSALQHRGPDATGLFNDDVAGLVHTRLSIIDLNESANQPMASACGRYVAVFNGEIYNYQELAREHRLSLSTCSDTEVILQLYMKYGGQCVDMFNGMFAIAIYDKAEKSLWLARDRMGVKPLFYYWDGNAFAFASEIKALLCLSHINKYKSASNVAINEYLHLGYIPFPHTIWNNISKFPTGSTACVKGTTCAIQSYWDLDKVICSDLVTDEVQAREQLRDLLVQSVRYRLKSDVPFGAFLSGGVDSSTVVAIAQHQLSKPLNTFSIGFEESKYNEASHAREIADYLRTNHHELIVSHREAAAMMANMLDIFDEPFADSSAIPTMLVSRMARQHVSMSLSGDGGDELFMGYGMYEWATRLNSPLLKLLHKPASLALSLGNNRMKRAATVLDYRNQSTLRSHIFSQEQYLFSRSEIRDLLKKHAIRDIKLDENAENANRQLTVKEQQSLFDMKYYLPDNLLVKVDRASMRYGLEARVPILDYNIVEFSLNLHEQLKCKDNTQKYLLKQVLYDYVPSHFFDRPKWGFSIPLQEWLRGDLRFLIDEYLSETAVGATKILDYKIVEHLKKQYLEYGRGYLYNRIWLLVVLQHFLMKNT